MSKLNAATFFRNIYTSKSGRSLMFSWQEAQLALRNRAPVMHFFVAQLVSIALITTSVTFETYVRWTGWFITHAERIKISYASVKHVC